MLLAHKKYIYLKKKGGGQQRLLFLLKIGVFHVTVHRIVFSFLSLLVWTSMPGGADVTLAIKDFLQDPQDPTVSEIQVFFCPLSQSICY